MKKKSASQSGIFNPRVLLAFALCSVGALLAVLSFAANPPSWQLLQSGTPGTRNGATTVYDPALGVNVMFGGTATAGPLEETDETWTFDGQAWSRVLTAHTPLGRHGASMAYDPVHQVVLLFGGVDNNAPCYCNKRLNDTWSFNGVDWTQLAPANSPSPRGGASMVFDAARSQILLFGGSPDTNAPPEDNDTWTWDGTNWTQQQPLVSPQTPMTNANGPGRYNASMAYDPDAQMVVLFGGGQTGYPGLNDTWEWNGTTWTPFVSASPPPGRLGAIMDYDAASRSLVLFGGSPSTLNAVPLNDTWTWDPTNGWKQLSPPNSPPPCGGAPGTRGSMSGAYDPKTSRLYFSHGWHPNTGDTDETWSWDQSTWTQIKFNNIPRGRLYSVLGYDAAHDDYVLFGGLGLDPGGNVSLNDTWIWKGGAWTQAHPANSPPAQIDAQIAYDPGSGKLVLFGGSTISFGSCIGDTWTWDGSNWHQESPTTPPPVMRQVTLASDPATGNVVMFGGFNCSSNSLSNSTWTYTQGQWTKVNPSLSPPARSSATMAYDPRGYLVLFGGSSSSTYWGDTWIWDGTTWSLQSSPTFPPPRRFAAMALDEVTSGHLVLYGGEDSSGGNLSDTWLWMESAGWAQQSLAVSPDPRWIPAMAPAGSSSAALLFGSTYRNDLWGFGPRPPILTSVVSRKTHGSAGTFDISLPLSGTRGVECRNVGALPGGATGDYQLVFSFANPLTSVGGASLSSGTGTVSSSAIGSDAHQYIVTLSGVPNAQYVTATLNSVHDNLGNVSAAVSGTMGVLLGDVNASGLVDGNDVSAVQGQARQTANSTNFRLDVNTTGLIDGNDVSLVQSKTRTSLP